MLFFPFLVSSGNFFSFDPEYGVLGWLNDSYAFVLVALINAPLTGVLGNLGFYTAYYYWPMQIVAGTMLIEPFIAQVVGVVLGQDEAPGAKTWIGCIVITLGFLIAGLGAKFKSTSKEEVSKPEELWSDNSEYTRIE